MLWPYELVLDAASIVPSWPAYKLKSDYQQCEQVHGGKFVCLETAGIHITGLQFHSAPDVDHYVAPAMRTQLISTHLKFEAPACDK